MDFYHIRSSRRTEAEDERWMDDWEEERYSDRYYSDRHEQKTGKRRRSTGKRPVHILAAVIVFALVFFMGRGVRSLAGSLFGAGNVNVTGDSILPEADALLGKKTAAVKNKQIVYLDAGHGGKDQGTSYQEVLEKDINLAVAKKVQKLLTDAGYQVEMTRSDDTKVDNYTRAEMANKAGANVFDSIHCNYLEKGEANGIEIYHDSNNAEGGVLAKKTQSWLVNMTGAKDRGTRTEDFIVTRETTMPSILVELGYLSDSTERARLLTDSYQNLLAGGIARGVREYLAGVE